MKITDQVCSLELSKKLKELGVKQESLFYWHKSAVDGKWMITFDLLSFEGWNEEETYSAFTVAELGEMLPNYISVSKCGGGRFGTFACWQVCSNANSREGDLIRAEKGQQPFYKAHYENETNMANAMAKMLIYLIENKLISNE